MNIPGMNHQQFTKKKEKGKCVVPYLLLVLIDESNKSYDDSVKHKRTIMDPYRLGQVQFMGQGMKQREPEREPEKEPEKEPEREPERDLSLPRSIGYGQKSYSNGFKSFRALEKFTGWVPDQI